MENGDEVSKRACLCPQEFRGGNYPQDILGGEGKLPQWPTLYTPLKSSSIFEIIGGLYLWTTYLKYCLPLLQGRTQGGGGGTFATPWDFEAKNVPNLINRMCFSILSYLIIFYLMEI